MEDESNNLDVINNQCTRPSILLDVSAGIVFHFYPQPHFMSQVHHYLTGLEFVSTESILNMCWQVTTYVCNKFKCERVRQGELSYNENCGKDLMNHFSQHNPQLKISIKMCDYCTGQAIDRAVSH